MGMSLMVTTAIWLFAQAWINTRAVDFGALVASRNFETLDRIFRNVLAQSTAVVVTLSTAVMIGVEVLRHIGHPLAERLLPPLPLFILIIATVLVVANRFGATGMVTVLALAMAVVGVGGGTVLFVSRRRQWRTEAVSTGSAAIEVPLA
jgi:hypothetical protein